MSLHDHLSSGEEEKQTESVTFSDADPPSRFSAWFGGESVVIGPRIGPVLDSLALGADDGTFILDKQLAAEDGNAIQYRTCSWQKVCTSFRVPTSSPLATADTYFSAYIDCRLALFRVHLFGRISDKKCRDSADRVRPS